jgi:hypothetical protein
MAGYLCNAELHYPLDNIERTAVCGFRQNNAGNGHEDGESYHEGNGKQWSGSTPGEKTYWTTANG